MMSARYYIFAFGMDLLVPFASLPFPSHSISTSDIASAFFIIFAFGDDLKTVLILVKTESVQMCFTCSVNGNIAIRSGSSDHDSLDFDF